QKTSRKVIEGMVRVEITAVQEHTVRSSVVADRELRSNLGLATASRRKNCDKASGERVFNIGEQVERFAGRTHRVRHLQTCEVIAGAEASRRSRRLRAE